MHGDNIFKIINLFSIFGGVALLMSAVQKMQDSGYRPPQTPSGWSFGIFFISLGGISFHFWVVHTISALVHQKNTRRRRWSLIQIMSSSMVLFGAMSFALFGVYMTWKYPYKFGPCECTENQWGPQCLPCKCGIHGVCDWGQYGTGTCNCEPQWGGVHCDVCNERWKPEPSGNAPACNICKTGWTGDKCEKCAKGYSGEDCSVCAEGWRPWTNSSELFPNTISSDDGRHICDECKENHFGYYCTRCPYGTDVPIKSLERNDRIQNGTMVQTSNGKYGIILNIQTLTNDQWGNIQYNPSNFNVLSETRVLIMEETTKRIDWKLLSDISSVKCNNRGICMDDELHLRQNPKDTTGKYPWEKTCTSNGQSCSAHTDCLKSENCRGQCRGIDIPIDTTWNTKFSGQICEKDSDCQDNGNYKGGRCMAKTCCQESWHGSGQCQCQEKYFGDKLNNGKQEHYQKSPACDFCPGYDWISGKQNSICSGNKGTCAPSFSRISLDGSGGIYQKMTCNCGKNVYIDPVTKIVFPDKIVSWSGSLCECGDWNQDSKCDVCADGFWGPSCKMCPGGSGLNQCSRKGKCDSGVDGTGNCNCLVTEKSSWMLAPFVKRYPNEPIGYNSQNSSCSCTDCAPNYWGESCQQCEGMEKGSGGGTFPLSQLSDIFQPISSFGQSSAYKKPTPICNRGFCYMACNGGGWCNWGRKGDGTCTCWSNMMGADSTWNPLDNVCMGNQRGRNASDGDESCPSFGWCSEGKGSSRIEGQFDACGGDDEWIGGNKTAQTSWNRNVYVDDQTQWSPFDDWKKNNYDVECQNMGVCRKWQPISWTVSNSRIGCKKLS